MQRDLVLFVFPDDDRTPGLSWVITCTRQQRSRDQAGGDHVTRRSDNSDLLSDWSKYKQIYTNVKEFFSKALPLLHIRGQVTRVDLRHTSMTADPCQHSRSYSVICSFP